MKSGIRILGIDDGAFNFKDSSTPLVGVIYRGTEFIEDIKLSEVSVDGEDATDSVLELYDLCNNPRQIKAIMVDGISFAGFNITDIDRVAEETGKPVIAITSNKPDRSRFKRVMERTGNSDKKFDEFDEPEIIELEDGEVYVQYSGASFEDVKSLVESSIIHGLTPEPIRVAHMIGKALKGQ